MYLPSSHLSLLYNVDGLETESGDLRTFFHPGNAANIDVGQPSQRLSWLASESLCKKFLETIAEMTQEKE